MKKIINQLKIISPMILMGIIFLLITLIIYLKYTYNLKKSKISSGDINNSEIVQKNTPTPISHFIDNTRPPDPVASKTISGITFHLREDTADAVKLYKGDNAIDLNALPINGDRVQDFWYDEAQNKLIVVENRGHRIGKQTFENIISIDLNSKPINFQSLGLFTSGLYSGTHILNYYSDSEILLLETAGGDGCGGYGKIWKLVGTYFEDIQEVGAGCFKPELPRFIGNIGDELVFATGNYDPIKYQTELNELYTFNPLTYTTTTLLGREKFPTGISWSSVSTENSNIILLSNSNQTLYEFDVTNYNLTPIN